MLAQLCYRKELKFAEISHQDLSLKMSTMGAKLILDAIELIENNKVNFVEQRDLMQLMLKIEK